MSVNHEVVKRLTRDQFIAQHSDENKDQAGLEYDKIVPPAKLEDKKADKKV